jgi:hypothetical protein
MLNTFADCEWLVKQAEIIFADNLRFAFIGGSYASGTATSESDIDVFIVIESADLIAERVFCERFCELHRRHGHKFTHIGELFTLATLDRLLNMTENMTERASFLLRSACYRRNCILSALRKGIVVMGFLADTKICRRGNAALLDTYTGRAIRYFETIGDARSSSHLHYIEFLQSSESAKRAAQLREEYENAIRLNGIEDTPVGVGLGRWFGRDHEWPSPEVPVTATRIRENLCPLALPANSNSAMYAYRQCLVSVVTCKAAGEDSGLQ